MKRTQIWSSGGGVQSSAIAALILTEAIERPDIAVIVDTERECSTTWEYINNFVIPCLEKFGVTLHRVPKSSYATVDIYRGDDLLIPAFTTKNGGVGKLPTFCSNEWKSRVVERWAKSEFNIETATLWIGFSADEEYRAWRRKEGETEKWKVRFPLLDARMRRHHCIELVKSLGWPSPPKSRCWMCPNQSDNEWDEIMKSDDANKVIEFDGYIRNKDSNIWLTRHAKTIQEIDFSDNQLDLFGKGCDSGQCFV